MRLLDEIDPKAGRCHCTALTAVSGHLQESTVTSNGTWWPHPQLAAFSPQLWANRWTLSTSEDSPWARVVSRRCALVNTTSGEAHLTYSGEEHCLPITHACGLTFVSSPSGTKHKEAGFRTGLPDGALDVSPAHRHPASSWIDPACRDAEGSLLRHFCPVCSATPARPSRRLRHERTYLEVEREIKRSAAHADAARW